jgi:hypothetical protein
MVVGLGHKVRATPDNISKSDQELEEERCGISLCVRLDEANELPGQTVESLFAERFGPRK